MAHGFIRQMRKSGGPLLGCNLNVNLSLLGWKWMTDHTATRRFFHQGNRRKNPHQNSFFWPTCILPVGPDLSPQGFLAQEELIFLISHIDPDLATLIIVRRSDEVSGARKIQCEHGGYESLSILVNTGMKITDGRPSH